MTMTVSYTHLVVLAAVYQTSLAGIAFSTVVIRVAGHDHALFQTVGIFLVDLNDFRRDVYKRQR